MKQIVVVLFLALAVTSAASRIELPTLPQGGDADTEVSE